MNIVVCVKSIISPDCPIRVEGSNLANRGLSRVVNPCDLVAVEEAVQLKESLGRGSVTVVCMSPIDSDKVLYDCLAIGADRTLMLLDAAFDGSDSYATAITLAAAIRRLKHDIIFCGQRSADTAGGQFGAILAELLGIAVISSAIEVNISQDGTKLTAVRRLDKGMREMVETATPVLVTVETGLNRPRYPRLRAVLDAQRGLIEKKDAHSLGLNLTRVGFQGSKTRLVGFSSPRPKLRKVFTPPSNLSPEERVQALLTGGLVQKKSEFLEGAPDDVANILVQFLKEKNLVG